MLLTKILFTILFSAFASGQKVHFWRRSTVANRFFAHKLYHQVARNTVMTSNVFVSPYAVSAGLSMCLYGSDGDTAEQLVRALEYQDIDDARQHLQNDPEKHEKIARLYQKMKEQLIDVDHGFILNAPNKIFSGDVVLQDYRDGVLKYFNSETMQVDFAGDVETAIAEINDFVYNATNGTIEEAVGSDSVDSSTKLVLVSTLFFNGAWKFPFDPKMTKMGDFTLYDGTTVPADFMVEAMAVNFCNSYGDEEGELPVVYVELPYKTDSSRYGIVMELILPHEKGENAMRQVENGIDEGTMNLLRKKAYKAGVQVRLPKFSIEYARDLVDDLKHMGINDMFDPLHADFSLINGKKNLFFSSAQHKTYLEVNERGTVASASFAAASTRSTAYASFDRPFFVVLREVYTRMPLFMGRISNPNQ